jgi:hypothetical protein
MTTTAKADAPPAGAIMIRFLRHSGGSVHLVRVPAADWPAVLAELSVRDRRYFAVQCRPRGVWCVFIDGPIKDHPSEREGLRGDQLTEAVLAELERASPGVASCGPWWRPAV